MLQMIFLFKNINYKIKYCITVHLIKFNKTNGNKCEFIIDTVVLSSMFFFCAFWREKTNKQIRLYLTINNRI